jgi:hypothetical protein
MIWTCTATNQVDQPLLNATAFTSVVDFDVD